MKGFLALVLACLLAVLPCLAEEVFAPLEGVRADAEYYARADLTALGGRKLGVTVQSLRSAYWAEVMPTLQEILELHGAEATIVACDDNAEAQEEQIESFISTGCDLIAVQPADAFAAEEVCARARAAGIKLVCIDDIMENSDVNWVLDDHALGLQIGQLAAAFINERYGGDNKAEVIVIGKPERAAMFAREEGIVEGLAEAAGKYEIVAELSAGRISAARKGVEEVLAEHPGAKVVAGVNADAMIGASEALKASVKGGIPEDMGVFAGDVTRRQLECLLDAGDPARCVIGYEGSDEDTAEACAAMMAMVLDGEVEERNVIREMGEVGPERVGELMREYE